MPYHLNKSQIVFLYNGELKGLWNTSKTDFRRYIIMNKIGLINAVTESSELKKISARVIDSV